MTYVQEGAPPVTGPGFLDSTGGMGAVGVGPGFCGWHLYKL